MSGRGIVESEVFRTEQVSRVARTSDPSSPVKGDTWIRTDVQPVTDSVAALRVQGDSGYLEAPLFDPSATLGSDVHVGQRFLFADGTEGHLLVTDQGGAVGSPRVVTSSGTVYQSHDALEVNVIPDSVVMQYYANTWSQGETTWVDDAGTAQNLSLTGDFQAGTLSDGADSIDGDGTNDHGTVTLPSDFEGASLQSFSIELAIEYTALGGQAAFGVRNNDAIQFLTVTLNLDEVANTDDGNLRFNLTDANGDKIRAAPTTNPSLNDGDRHNVSIIVNDSSTNDVEMIIDGSSVALSFEFQQSPASFTTWDVDCAVYARNLGGSIGFYSDIELGAMRWHNTGIASQTIDDYP